VCEQSVFTRTPVKEQEERIKIKRLIETIFFIV